MSMEAHYNLTTWASNKKSHTISSKMLQSTINKSDCFGRIVNFFGKHCLRLYFRELSEQYLDLYLMIIASLNIKIPTRSLSIPQHSDRLGTSNSPSIFTNNKS